MLRHDAGLTASPVVGYSLRRARDGRRPSFHCGLTTGPTPLIPAMDVAVLAAHVEAAVAPLDDVVAVYLFGSVASRTDTAESDIDLGVLYDATPPARLDAGPLDLEGDLERRLGRAVHLVVLNGAPADLRIRVLRAQHLLVKRNRAARIRFEVATRNEFFDLERMLVDYRRPRKEPA